MQRNKRGAVFLFCFLDKNGGLSSQWVPETSNKRRTQMSTDEVDRIISVIAWYGKAYRQEQVGRHEGSSTSGQAGDSQAGRSKFRWLEGGDKLWIRQHCNNEKLTKEQMIWPSTCREWLMRKVVTGRWVDGWGSQLVGKGGKVRGHLVEGWKMSIDGSGGTGNVAGGERQSVRLWQL